MFERYVPRCGSKNGRHNDMCLEEVGLRAQNMLTILSSTINLIRETYTTTEWTQENLHFDNNQDIHTSSENCEANGYGHE